MAIHESAIGQSTLCSIFFRDQEILRNCSKIYCETLDKRLVDNVISEVCFDWTFFASTSAVVFVVFLLVIVMFYKFNKDIKIFLYYPDMCLWCAIEEELDKDKIYDAFLCLAAIDQHLVEWSISIDLKLA